jgi:hypothetical protein
LIEKQQGRQGLLVRRRRRLAFIGEPRQERFDLRLAHLRRMAHAMKPHEGTHPMHVGLLGSYAVVQIADALTHLVEQSDGLQRRKQRDAAFHDGLALYERTV